MRDPHAFVHIPRKKESERSVQLRVLDSREVTIPFSEQEKVRQASRCMNCGIPFCHSPVSTLPGAVTGGCPLENLIPEWNDLVARGRMDEAAARLLSTNNFPEVTGRVCPAPCEASCVLAIDEAPVAIKAIERSIADHLFAAGSLAPIVASERSNRKVCVIGSGPAGLAAAQELTRLGHDVTVFERDDRLGGLLRYGIPDFKLEKGVVDRRIAQLTAEGVRFQCSVAVGETLSASEIEREYDAVIVATGARAPRDLVIPGRHLAGIHFAMDYLTAENRRVAGDAPDGDSSLHARGRKVVVIGGGDTGSDCVGTAHRQGAAQVLQLELQARPNELRAHENPWPDWPFVLRTSSSHAEGGERQWSVQTRAFRGDTRVTHLEVTKGPLPSVNEAPRTSAPEILIECDLVLLAMGFAGGEPGGAVAAFQLARDPRGNIAIDADGATSRPGVFAAGDASRGQSLVVWAIADGRRAARGVARHLAAATHGRARK